MLMEAMLIKSLFSKPQAPSSKSDECSVLPSLHAITSTPKTGTSIWSRRGEYMKESASSKMRIMLNENPQSYIAVQNESKDKSWYTYVRDHLTHISVQSVDRDGASQSVSLNIGS